MLIPTTLVQEDNSTFGLTLLYDQTLQADAASFDVQNIPAGYRVLEVIAIIRTTEAVDLSGFNMIFNNDSGANYDAQRLSAVHTTVSGNAAPASSAITNNAAGANQNAGAAGIMRMIIPGYDQTIFHKTVEVYNGNSDDTTTNNRVDVRVNRWKSTAAINRITFTPTGGNFLAGSRVIVYGLAGAPVFMSQAPGYELDYVQIISSVPISATTAATANTCITANPITFDGSTRICIESFSPYIGTGTTNLSSITVVLYDNSTQVGIIGFHGRGDGDDHVSPHSTRRYLTPSAGTHTYSIRAYRGASNGSFNAGAGGDDTFLPAYLRITRA